MDAKHWSQPLPNRSPCWFQSKKAVFVLMVGSQTRLAQQAETWQYRLVSQLALFELVVFLLVSFTSIISLRLVGVQSSNHRLFLCSAASLLGLTICGCHLVIYKCHGSLKRITGKLSNKLGSSTVSMSTAGGLACFGDPRVTGISVLGDPLATMPKGRQSMTRHI